MKGVFFMEIKNLEIKNYGGVAHVTVPDGKLTALLGKNGVGKSTTIDAIRFLLTGKSSYGVKQGATEGSIKAVVCGVNVQRYISTSGTSLYMAGKKTTNKSFEEFLEREGININALKLTTSSELLEAMNAGQLSDFFIKNNYLPVELTTEDIILSLGPDMSEQAIEELKKEFPEGTFSISEISRVYDVFFKRRREHKAVYKMPKVMEKPVGDLLDLKSQYEEICKKEGAASAAKEAYHLFTETQRNLQKYKETMLNLANEIAAIPYKGDDVSKEIELLQKQLDDGKERINSLTSQITVLVNTYNTNKELLDKLCADTCPLDCSIKCTTDKSSIRKKINDLLSEVASNGARLKEERKKIKEDLEQLYKKKVELETQQKDFEKRCNLENQMKSLPKPNKVEKPAVEPDNTDYSRKKIQIQNLIQAHQEYDVFLKESEKQKKIKQIIDTSDELVKALGSKSSLMEQIISIGISDLEEVCNEQARKIKSNYRLKFAAEAGLKVTIIPKAGGAELPISGLSTGERTIALLLLMDLINQVSGANILLLDDMEKLDVVNMSQVSKFLKEIECDKIYVASVAHSGIEKMLNPDVIVKYS